MKLSKLVVVLMMCLSFLFAGDAYKYVDIGECIVPISKNLEKRGKGQHYDEKNYVGSYIDPMAISIEKNSEKTAKLCAKTKKILHLNKKIIISDFQVFTDNKKVNSNRLVYLKNHVIFLFGNNPLPELNYMLEYCRKTQQ